jgi:hypothetical protein
MSYTKRELVQAALTEIGLSSYAFDLSTDQLAQAVARLDSMMAEWNGRGVRLGYPIPASPSGSDISADSGIPDSAWEAVITNLALRLGPSYGKAVSAETKTTARQAWNTILARSAMPQEMRLGPLPAGAGNKGDAFLAEMDSGVVEHPDQSVTFQGA